MSAAYRVRHEGREIALHEMGGDEAAPLLLLCHATGFSAPCYRRLAVELQDSYHVLGPDFRGHGDTQHVPGESFDWRQLADDLLVVIDFCRQRFSQEQVFGFGHSMGGALLLHVALALPGALEAAYLYEPIVLPDELAQSASASNPLAESARRRRPSFGSRAEALLRYASRPPLDRFEAGVLHDYVEHCFKEEPDETITLKCDPAVEAATFEADGKPQLEELRGIELPSLVASGGDGGFPSLWAPAVAEVLPGARLARHRLLGHFGPLESPRLVAEEMRDFLAAV